LELFGFQKTKMSKLNSLPIESHPNITPIGSFVSYQQTIITPMSQILSLTLKRQVTYKKSNLIQLNMHYFH